MEDHGEHRGARPLAANPILACPPLTSTPIPPPHPTPPPAHLSPSMRLMLRPYSRVRTVCPLAARRSRSAWEEAMRWSADSRDHVPLGGKGEGGRERDGEQGWGVSGR